MIQLGQSWPDRVLRAPAMHPRTTLGIAVFVVTMAIASILRLQPMSSLESMMDQSEPSAHALGRIVTDFGSVDNLLIVASMTDENDGDETMLAAFAARLEQAIAADAELSSWVSEIRCDRGALPEDRVFVEERVIPAGLYYLEDQQFEGLMKRLTLESMRDQIRRNEELIAAPGPAADALNRILQKDPLRLRDFLREVLAERVRWGLSPDHDPLLSKDRRSILIIIGAREPATDLDFTKRFMQRLRAVAQQVNANHLHLGYSGAYAIAATSERAIRNDMIGSLVVAVLLMQVMFLVMHRRPLTFVMAFLPTAVAIVVAFGVYAVFERQLTPVTAVVGAIIAGLGIDYSIHLLSHYARARHADLGPVDAAHMAAHELLLPTVAAAGTTFIGVLAIAQSPVGALRDFSSIALMGLVGAMAAAFTILPAILVLGDRFAVGDARAANRFEARITLNGLTSLIERHARRVLVIAAAIWAIVIGYVMLQDTLVPIERDLTVMHPRPNQALALQELIARDFDIAANTLLVHVEAPTPEALMTASHRVAKALQSEDIRSIGVTGVLGLSTLLPDPRTIEMRKTMISQINVDAVLKSFRAAIDDSIFSPDAFGDVEIFLSQFLNPAEPPDLGDLRGYGRIAARFLPRNGEFDQTVCVIQLAHPLADRETRDNAIAMIRAALNGIPKATLTGLSVISHDVERSIANDLARLSVIAAVSVIVFLACFVRNPFHLMLALTPTALGLTVVLAGFHLFNEGLNMMNLIGIPLLMGVGDNFGIFVVDALRKYRRGNLGIKEMTSHLSASGRAITMTSITAILGFGSLVFTSTPAIQSLGRLTSLGITASLAGTFFIVMPITFLVARSSENRSCP